MRAQQPPLGKMEMALDIQNDVPTSAETALTHLTRRVQRLYSLPGAALQVVRLAGEPHVSAQALKEAVETDPALTSKILAVVNSSLFGLRERIADLHRAIAMLGIKPLRLLVLGLSLPRNLLDVEVDLLSSYWRMCLSKSVAAKLLSERFYARRMEEEAFIAALLQDLGMLVLIQQLQGPYIELLTHSREVQADLLEVEQCAMGFDHRALSAALLEEWRLPDSIVAAISLPLHGNLKATSSNDERILGEVLGWADLYGRFMAGNTRLWPKLQELAQQRWHLETEELDELMRQLDDHVRALAVAYGIDARSWPDLTLLLQDAYSALSQSAEDHVRQWLGNSSVIRALADMQREEDGTAGTTDSAKRPSSRQTSPHDQAEGAPTPMRLPRAAALQRSAMDSQLLARIAAAAEVCRRMRQPLSLISCEIDRHDEMLALGGINRIRQITDFVESSILDCVPHAAGLSLGDSRFALVLEDCDRAEALRIARELADHIGDKAPRSALPGGCGVSLSMGVASLPVPPRNFAPEDLLAASRRCLYAASASGGNMIKSIDLM